MKQLFLLVCLMGILTVSAQEGISASPDAKVEFKLHPNPVFDGLVYIDSNHSGPKTIRIYDLFGKAVLERRFSSSALRLDALVPGVYMVQLHQNGQMATKKLVIR